MVLGMQGLTRSDPRRYTLSVLNAALGGGTSSRLFQEVRERRGLAYSVYSFASATPTPAWSAWPPAPCRARPTTCSRSSRDELARWPTPGSPRRRSSAARASSRGGLVLSLEDSGSRMTRLGEAELFQRGCSPSTRCSTASTRSPSPTSHALAAELFARPETLALVGPS